AEDRRCDRRADAGDAAETVATRRPHPRKYKYAPKIAARTKTEAATSRQSQLARVFRLSSSVDVPKVKLLICAGDGGEVIMLTATITTAETIVIRILKYWKKML